MSAPVLPENPEIYIKERIEKGMLFWFDLTGGDSTIITGEKIRPVCVIGRSNRNSNRVIISPVSDIEKYTDGNKLKYPYHVPLLKSKYPFMEKDSVILLDQVFTISKSELYKDWFIGKLTDFTELDNGLLYNYDLFQSVIDSVNERVSSMISEYSSKFSRR